MALAGAGQDAITGAGVVAVISAVWIFAFIKLLQKVRRCCLLRLLLLLLLLPSDRRPAHNQCPTLPVQPPRNPPAHPSPISIAPPLTLLAGRHVNCPFI